MKNEIVILGAGLAGISVAYHLNPNDYDVIIFEKNNSIGGTASTIQMEGFTFDIAIHLLHLREEYTKKLINDLLKNNLCTGVRQAAIYIYDKLIPYPFQVNTYLLPKNVINECVTGFKKAVKNYANPTLRPTTLTFIEWCKRTFGTGITKHFMKPYNEKIWQVKSTEMNAEWCGMFVPQPKLEDVINGSKGYVDTPFGYNATFLYPKNGGIQVLSEALGKNLNIQLNTPFDKLNLKKKTVQFSNGCIHHYDTLISTIPLNELLKRISDLPKEISELINKLRWTSVLCVNLGINRPNISDKSWIYFPEKKFIFYRVGFPMNFTPYAVPKNSSSMYVEISYPPHKPLAWQKPEFLIRIQKDLQTANILQSSDRIIVSHFVPIHYAYVIYTHDRKITLEKIFAFLQEKNIFCVGRYGEWKYSYMEEAILDGKKIAEKISRFS